jgi:hypothetical protein
MTSPPVQVERRVGQRFGFHLPVSFREISGGAEGVGCTQNLSSRGVSFLTSAPLHEGGEIELTLMMPSEITLGESMRVRCRGQILRIIRPAENQAAESSNSQENASPTESKIEVAVLLQGYEYLAEPAETSPNFPRVSVLRHGDQDDTDRRLPVPASPGPGLG